MKKLILLLALIGLLFGSQAHADAPWAQGAFTEKAWGEAGAWNYGSWGSAASGGGGGGTPPLVSETNCADSIDNDGDGDTDCLDSDCQTGGTDEDLANCYNLVWLFDAPGDDGLYVGANTYDFNGTTQYATVPDSDDFSFTDGAGNDLPFSVCAWVRREDAGANRGIVNKYGNGSSEFEWTFDASAYTVQTYIVNSAGTAYIGRECSTAFPAGNNFQWNYVCMTYDGNEGSPSMDASIDLYSNGHVCDNLNIGAGSYTGMTNGAGDLAIAARTDAGGNKFNGTIGRISIFSKELSQSEVVASMTANTCSDVDTNVGDVAACWDMVTDLDSDVGSHNATGVGSPAPASPANAPGLAHDSAYTHWALVNGSTHSTAGMGTEKVNGYVFDSGNALPAMAQGSLVWWGSGTTNNSGFWSTSQTSVATGITQYSGVDFAEATGTFINLLDRSNYGGGLSVDYALWAAAGKVDIISNLSFLDVSLIDELAIDTDYQTAIVLGGYDSSCVPYLGSSAATYNRSAAYFIKGGAYTNWELLWFGNTAQTTCTKATSVYSAFTASNNKNNELHEYIIPADTTTFQGVLNTAINTWDSFTGTNGQTVESGGTYSGTERFGGSETTWHKRTDECAGGAGDSSWTIHSNAVDYTTAGTDCTYNTAYRYIYVDANEADSIVDARVKCDATNGIKQGIMFRGGAETASGMNTFAFSLVGDGTNCDYYLEKIEDGSITTTSSNTGGTATDTTVYWLRAISANENLQGTVNMIDVGVSATSVATFKTNTRVGIVLNGDPLTDPTADNFTVFPRGTGGEYSALDSY